MKSHEKARDQGVLVVFTSSIALVDTVDSLLFLEVLAYPR